MPRQSGIYYLPSPPAPLQPHTLAQAEDVNALFQDVAQALTGSIASDGSGVLNGPINANGQNIGGAGNLSATGTVSGGVISAGSYVTSPQYYGTNVNVTGPIVSSGARIIAEGSGNNPSVTVWDPGQNVACALLLGGGNILYLANVDGAGNYVSARMTLDAGANLGITGLLTASGGASLGSDANLNNHNVLNCANVQGVSGGGALGIISNNLIITGPVNHNNQNVGAINALSAATVTAGTVSLGGGFYLTIQAGTGFALLNMLANWYILADGGAFVFVCNGTRAMRIDGSGNVTVAGNLSWNHGPV